MPEGTHEKMWARFQAHCHKILSITKIKSHLKWDETQKLGFTRKDWLGNKEADRLAGIGADAHGYTPQEITSASEHAGLVDEVQQHMVGNYVRMLKHPRVIQDRKDQKARAAEKNKQGRGKVGRPVKFPQDKGHKLRFQDGKSEYCAGCGRCTTTQDKARHSFWLRNTCSPVTQFNKKLIQGNVMRMSKGKWYCDTCGARDKDLYRPCAPQDKSSDLSRRCQAELETANNYLVTCEDCDCSPPVFAAAEDMGQSCPHLEGDAADRQCGPQDFEVCTEPETVEKRSAGVEVV